MKKGGVVGTVRPGQAIPRDSQRYCSRGRNGPVLQTISGKNGFLYGGVAEEFSTEGGADMFEQVGRALPSFTTGSTVGVDKATKSWNIRYLNRWTRGEVRGREKEVRDPDRKEGNSHLVSVRPKLVGRSIRPGFAAKKIKESKIKSNTKGEDEAGDGKRSCSRDQKKNSPPRDVCRAGKDQKTLNEAASEAGQGTKGRSKTINTKKEDFSKKRET